MKSQVLIGILATFAFAGGAWAAASKKVCGVYTNIIAFDNQEALNLAVHASPSFLSDKHKRMMAHSNVARNISEARQAGFNTLFMTIYPIWGQDWWDNPAARNLIKDALLQTRGKFHVHLGLSIFNGNFTDDWSRYPGACQTVQCDGTKPSSVCFYDDALWKTYIRNMVELAKVGKEVPGVLDGLFIDPEGYGGEHYLCFCDNCVRKFDTYEHVNMPTGLVKPDSWLLAHGMWKKYTQDWLEHEILRHATDMRKAIHAVDPNLQLSSLLWDYPVAVGVNDARQKFFRYMAMGLGTRQKPSWTLPEHTYYSDAADLDRIINQMHKDISDMGADGMIKVLPGIRVLRRSAASLIDRGKVIKSADVPGYWMYELADLQGKKPIPFEGELIEPADDYWKAFAQMNRMIQGN